MQENFSQLKWNFINFILLEFLHKREELFQWGEGTNALIHALDILMKTCLMI